MNELKEPTLYHAVVTSLFSTSDNQIRTVRVGNSLPSAQNDIVSPMDSLQNIVGKRWCKDMQGKGLLKTAFISPHKIEKSMMNQDKKVIF